MSRPMRVRLLGRVAVDGVDVPAPAMPKKALELLCYLVLHGDRAHDREALARLLWPDAVACSARKYLRQALWQLQGALGTVMATPPVNADPASVRIDPTAWWCDAEVVERVHERCRAAAPGRLDADLADAVERAVALHRGELLESWDQDWCERARDRWRLMHLDLLDRLVDHHLEGGVLERGVAHAGRLLELDPAREVTHRRLMRLHAAGGDRPAALRQYRRCVQALATELDVGPDPHTVALHRQIQAGAPVSGPGDAPPGVDPGLVQRLDARLDGIAALLAALQRDVAWLTTRHRDDRDREAG